MSADTTNLDLDHEHYTKAQEIITLVNDLLKTENRQDRFTPVSAETC